MNDVTRGPMAVDAELVRQLAQLLAEGDLSEIEVEDGDRRIRLKRKIEQVISPAPVPGPVAAPVAAGFASTPAAVAPSAPAPADHPGTVKSPMVGTAYLSSEPGSKPFVSIGDTVSAGDTLLIVEAMKVMNAISATAPGTIRQILIQDGQPVEYDQPLVIVE